MIPESFPRPIGSVFPPQVIVLTNGASPIVIYDKTGADGGQKLECLQIQVVGTGALVVALNDDAGAGDFHKLLKACTADFDGLGETWVIPGNLEGIIKVSVFARADTKFCYLKKYLPL